MARAGIPSFVVTGNHDPLSGWEPSVRWPELAHRFDSHHVTSLPITRDGEEIARVYGISYRVRDVTTNLAATFRRDPDTPFAVGLLHANVGGIEGAANYAPCTLGDLRAADIDYWALGHIHRDQVLLADRPTAVYCGNPQGSRSGCFLWRSCQPTPRGPIMAGPVALRDEGGSPITAYGRGLGQPSVPFTVFARVELVRSSRAAGSNEGGGCRCGGAWVFS
jgi:exonuclease SbcD